VLADVAAKARGKLPVVAPLAVDVVTRIDAVFDIEREINGLPAAERLAVRHARVAPLVADLEAWMRAERAKLSRHAEVAKAMDYMLKRWAAFTRFLDDGRICLTNNAAERALRGIALGRKSWLTRSLAKQTGARNFCLAGGVALNCVANGKVLRDGKFDNTWVQSVAGDAGGSDSRSPLCRSDAYDQW